MKDYIDTIIDNIPIYNRCNICRNDCKNDKTYTPRDCREELRETIKDNVIRTIVNERFEKNATN